MRKRVLAHINADDRRLEATFRVIRASPRPILETKERPYPGRDTAVLAQKVSIS
ncbi:MAG: hypothetical protein H6654_17215 [Ardenticatenaceae bacterium]|nr:hypothetical protein [Anaerolineales bacterium]MCB8938387.1 hypothetical protein [Ardenticatenaceae bacterium]MCB8975303.1 hypothetical protein [Ardenticatenaceae bacterium]